MERWHTQEKLSQMLNIESLLTRLNQPQNGPASAPQVTEADLDEPTPLIGLDIQWPKEALSPKLRDRIQPVKPIDLPTTVFQALPTYPAQLSALFDILVKDVMASRDKLLLLNPGRRKMIEHRLEYIARKIARARGEKLNRSFSLPEILKESYRDTGQTKLGSLAWKALASEVALFQILELCLLKSLEAFNWRPFEKEDLGRMSFSIHSFLSQKATGFAHDKHCWNFVRTNLYSWYVPSLKARAELATKLESTTLSWNDRELLSWVKEIPADFHLQHLDFGGEQKLADFVSDLLENQLGFRLVSEFHAYPVCKKVLIPALEMGGVALSFLDQMLEKVYQNSADITETELHESTQLQRALWGCESESFEAFWTEVLALLKIIKASRCYQDRRLTASTDDFSLLCPLPPQRIPQALHAVQLLGLELHNMDQLPLGGPEVSKMHQGSAGQIQQLETFDLGVVCDHIDRAKSARWVKALADQLPYWRGLVGSGSNLNWGELHLFLTLSKLKENGICLYFSHRQLPEGGDGDKLRKGLLNLSILDAFVELHEEACVPYRYLYIFRRSTNKLERDQHRPRFGQMRELKAPLDLSDLEEANSSQLEIAERGWEHLFVRGAAPLIRHLNHKFPKLFQLATLQMGVNVSNQGLFANGNIKALEALTRTGTDSLSGLDFAVKNPTSKPQGTHRNDNILVFPHNPVDLPWIQCLLNSPPAQFWIRHQVLAITTGSKQPRFQELRSCPIVDLSHAPSDMIGEALDWMGRAKPDAQALHDWACAPDSPLSELQAKYVAMARRYASLDRVVARYRPLFASDQFEEMRPEAISQFYPPSLLCQIAQSPEVRFQYVGRERCNLMPENWTLDESHSVLKNVGGKTSALVVVQTRQGPAIQILIPAGLRQYVTGQLKLLKDHTWGEALSLLKVPRDVSLFTAQTAEITRVVIETHQEMRRYQRVLDELCLDLFEISHDVRQFLPH